MDERCETCRFWRAGVCQRFPPTPYLTYGDQQNMCPETTADDWCGEWQPKPDAPEDQP